MKSKLQDIQHALASDTISKKGNVITARWGFFYTHGCDENHKRAQVLNTFPGCSIVDSGEVWKPFRGGATVAQGSHWYVKFELPTEKTPNEVLEAACERTPEQQKQQLAKAIFGE